MHMLNGFINMHKIFNVFLNKFLHIYICMNTYIIYSKYGSYIFKSELNLHLKKKKIEPSNLFSIHKSNKQYFDL